MKLVVHIDYATIKYFLDKKEDKTGFIRWALLLHDFHFEVIDQREFEN